METGNSLQTHIRAQENRTESEAQEAMLQMLRRLAYFLDFAFQVPYTKFRVGMDGILGLIPGIGDAIGTVLSLFIVIQAMRFGLPVASVTRMLYNVAIDTLIGTVPILGDLFDVAWKANMKNIEILEGFLNARK